MVVKTESKKELKVILTESETQAIEILCMDSDIPEETLLSTMLFESLLKELHAKGHGGTDIFRKIAQDWTE